MAVIFQNRTTDNAGTTPVSVTEDTDYQITVSGAFGGASLYVFVAQDSLRSVPVAAFRGPGLGVLTLKAGCSWYVVLEGASAETDIDASYV